MAAERVLRVRRSDEDNNAFVLIKVTAQGSHSLNLQLVGTEGVNPYLVTIKHSSIRKLRASNYQGTDQEWETLLRHTLLQEAPDPSTTSAAADLLDGVEAVATVSDGSNSDGQLTLLIRKDVGGITQRLGSINLAQDDEQEIELFDWAGTAAQSAQQLQADAVALRRALRDQQATVAALTAQLDDLVGAKREHEDELLAKFTQLLNAKKLKIRNQQRLLSGARIERPGAAPAGASSSGKKRRVGGKAAGGSESDDDGFAPAPAASAMDVDVEVKEEEDDEDEDERGPARETPEQTDTEDEEQEDDDSGGGNAALQRQRAGRGALSDSPAPEASSTLRPSRADGDEEASPPSPRRDVPITTHNLRSKPAEAPPKAAAAAADDDDYETEDDEL